MTRALQDLAFSEYLLIMLSPWQYSNACLSYMQKLNVTDGQAN